jgi:hypothetical protein
MSATRNDITGDVIASKVRGAKDMDAYRDNYDAIFGKKQVDADGYTLAFSKGPNDTYVCEVHYGEKSFRLTGYSCFGDYKSFVSELQKDLTLEKIQELIRQGENASPCAKSFTFDDHGRAMPFLSEDSPRQSDFGVISIGENHD